MSEIDGTALVVREDQVQSLLVGTPEDRVTQATQIANALAPVITAKKLFVDISGKRHVLYEGWATLGALVGVFPVTVETREDEEGAWARVEARTLAGAVVGAAEAVCSRDEQRWRTAPKYALLSMAQTRAGSKALRMPLGFIMQLAGFQPTPAEEMGDVAEEPPPLKEVADCSHGPRTYMSGEKNSKPWRGWFCPRKADGCKPVWVAVKAELSEIAEEVRHERGDPLKTQPEDLEGVQA